MKRRTIPSSCWRLARVAWEADNRSSYAEIARKIRVTRQAVFQRARSEGWARLEGGDPLLVQLADAGLAHALPASLARGLAEALRVLGRAACGPPARAETSDGAAPIDQSASKFGWTDAELV